jgi:hypothetical protein
MTESAASSARSLDSSTSQSGRSSCTAARAAAIAASTLPSAHDVRPLRFMPAERRNTTQTTAICRAHNPAMSTTMCD